MAVEGQVLLDGKPVSGAKVIRKCSRLFSKGQVYEDVVTGEDGRFRFEKIEDHSMFLTVFPHNTSVGQSLRIQYGEKEYKAFTYQKGNYRAGGEVYEKKTDKPIRFKCSLNEEEKERKHPVYSWDSYFGSCEILVD